MRFGVFFCFFGFSELSTILLSINSIKLQPEKKKTGRKGHGFLRSLQEHGWGGGETPRPEPRAGGFIVTSLCRPFRKTFPPGPALETGIYQRHRP